MSEQSEQVFNQGSTLLCTPSDNRIVISRKIGLKYAKDSNLK